MGRSSDSKGSLVSDGRTPTAVVLAGGGALGAFEAGVLLYALDTLPRELGIRPRLDIVAGTSVGGLNASLLAAYADDLALGARQLAAFWRALALNKIIRFGGPELGRAASMLLGRQTSWPPPEHHPRRARGAPHPPVAGFFDTTPLRELVSALIPWVRLQRNLRRGVLHGIALCATEVCSGTSVIFYQTGTGIAYMPGRDPAKEARAVRIRAEHALASAAIPFLFPAVQVDGVCYTDGSLRQNTPLNPALRLGAGKVLVISLAQAPEIASRIARLGCRRNPFPGALFLLGKTVKVLMSQTLDYELARIETYNRLIAGGCEAYGPSFLATLNEVMSTQRNARYRPVSTCHVRPSTSLDDLALQAFNQAPEELSLPGMPGRLVARLLGSFALAESELLSYLMFTPSYVAMLLDQGYRDARAQRETLVRWLAQDD